MRAEFAETAVALAERDSRVVLLTGDLGYSVLEPFAERFPDRFFNVGVAEQNLIGVATGLAEGGFLPFAYSIATFATLRPYEFIRNGPALHELPVRIIGVGGGFDYGHNGITHYALEDVAVMRAQPGMTAIIPADAEQARAALSATYDLPGPLYFRLARSAKPLDGLDGRFQLGRLETLGEGGDVAFIVAGSIASEAARAVDLLAQEGIDSVVGIVSSFNPDPTEDLADLLGKVSLAVTVESHYLNGGVGSLVCEVVAERGLGCRVVRCGVAAMPRGRSGSQEHLQEVHGLAAPALAGAAIRALSLDPH